MKKMFKKQGLDDAAYSPQAWLSAGLFWVLLSVAGLAWLCYQPVLSVLSLYDLPYGSAIYWEATRLQQNVPGVTYLLLYGIIWWGCRDLARRYGNLWLVALNASACRVVGSTFLVTIAANVIIGHILMMRGTLPTGEGSTLDWVRMLCWHQTLWQSSALLIVGVVSLMQVLLPDSMRLSDDRVSRGGLRARPQRLSAKQPTTGQHGTAKQADIAYLKVQGLCPTRKAARTGKGHILGKMGSRLITLPDLNRWRHTLVVAPPRSGKGVSIVIPRLLDATETVFVLDVKSELFQATYEERIRQGKRPYAIDPFNELGQYGDKFSAYQIMHYDPLNPIGMDLTDSKRRNKYVRALAGGLIEFTGLAHFDETAKTILMAVLNSYIGTGKTLINVYQDYASKGRQETIDALKLLCRDGNSLQASGAAALIEKVGDQEAGSMLSTFFRIFQDFADETLRDFFAKPQWNINEFLEGEADYYWVQSSSMIEEYPKMVRLILRMLRVHFELASPARIANRRYQVILDEVAQLSAKHDIEKLIEVYGEKGLCMTLVFQSLAQIEQFDKADLIKNFDIIHLFGLNDIKTVEWVQKLGGSRTLLSTSHNQSLSRSTTGWESKANRSRSQSNNEQEIGQPLFHFNEIRELDYGLQFVFIRNLRPIVCERVLYYQEPRYASRFGINYVENKSAIAHNCLQ